MDSKDIKAEIIESKIDSKTNLDSCLVGSVVNKTCLARDENVRARTASHNSEDPQKIGEILEDFLLGNADLKENLVCGPQTGHAFCTSADMKSDFEVERAMQRMKPHQNITVVIPNIDQLSSSPDITFGQTTLNMVEEFMASESPRSKTPGKVRKNKRSLFRRLFACC